MNKYSVQIAWSEEDEAYVANVPELPGCLADGPTEEAAIANLRVVAEEWLGVAREEGRPIPGPMTLQDYAGLEAKVESKFRKDLAEKIGGLVESLVQQRLRGFGSGISGPPDVRFDPASFAAKQ